MRVFLAALLFCPIAACAAQPILAAEHRPKAILVITYVMPRDVPDVRHQEERASLEECWGDAKDFVAHGVPKALGDAGALAVMGACLAPKAEEDDL